MRGCHSKLWNVVFNEIEWEVTEAAKWANRSLHNSDTPPTTQEITVLAEDAERAALTAESIFLNYSVHGNTPVAAKVASVSRV